MSIGRLLASGKSLVGGQSNSGRYRLDKRARLPKFGSTKNPFMQAKRTTPQPEAAEQAVATKQNASETCSPNHNVPPTLMTTPPVTARLRRAVRQIREWCADKNPIPRIAKPVRAAPMPRPASSPIQSELTLDEVKVVRNDLSEADLEIVPTKPVRRAEGAPLREDNAWSRLTTRIFVREHD